MNLIRNPQYHSLEDKEVEEEVLGTRENSTTSTINYSIQPIIHIGGGGGGG